jgi:hypothetical protein
VSPRGDALIKRDVFCSQWRGSYLKFQGKTIIFDPGHVLHLFPKTRGKTSETRKNAANKCEFFENCVKIAERKNKSVKSTMTTERRIDRTRVSFIAPINFKNKYLFAIFFPHYFESHLNRK